MMSAPRQDEKEPMPLDDAMIGKEEKLVVGVQNQRNGSQNGHIAASPHEAVRAPPPAPRQERDAHAPSPSTPPPHFLAPPPPPPHLRFQYNSAATIERIPYSYQFLVAVPRSVIGPTAVAIGPYHHGSPQLSEMDEAKSAAVEGFCRAAGRAREAVRAEMLSLAAAARRSYAADGTLERMDDGAFADMMLLDGCFLLQFMVSMCGGPPAAAADDALMSRGEVRRSINAIARDVMLLENQIPWPVLSSLMQLMTPPPAAGAVPGFVDRFITLMSSAFHIVGDVNDNANSTQTTHLRSDSDAGAGEPIDQQAAAPPHLLGLFHRRHMEMDMGTHQKQQQQGLLRIPIQLASLSSTAVELAEMGVKLAASKTKTFGDMAMTKRRRFGLFGELSLAPLVLNRLTECWLLNMAAYESRQLRLRQQDGAAAMAADSFPFSSYLTLVSLLVNRPEDVQEMRAKGLVVSAFDDRETLGFFKVLAPQLNVGDRYYDVFQQLQQYKQERWLWIAIHRFLYKNIRTIVAVFSIVGVLAGLFKTILSVKQPHG